MFNSRVWYKYHESDSPIGRRINVIVNSTLFWEDARIVVNIMKSVSKVLRLVDRDKKPIMGFLYETNVFNERCRK